MVRVQGIVAARRVRRRVPEVAVRALQFAEYGGPEVLHVADIEEPHAGPGQVRIAVHAVGVNPFDWKVRNGSYRAFMSVALPHTTGSDVAGVVDEVGDGVTGVAVGDEVFGFAVGGGAAEYGLLKHFAAKPREMSWEEAAALPVAVETAVRTLDLLGVRAGQTLLINGAAGGVGSAAVQLARARDAEVIGTASAENAEYLESLGARPTTYGAGLVDRVRALARDGVDAALDTAGRGALPDLIEITGSPDRVVTTADPAAQEYGVRLTSGTGSERAYQALGLAADLYQQGRFSLPVARTFDLENAAEAHRLSEEGHVRGKLVMLVG